MLSQLLRSCTACHGSASVGCPLMTTVACSPQTQTDIRVLSKSFMWKHCTNCNRKHPTIGVYVVYVHINFPFNRRLSSPGSCKGASMRKQEQLCKCVACQSSIYELVQDWQQAIGVSTLPDTASFSCAGTPSSPFCHLAVARSQWSSQKGKQQLLQGELGPVVTGVVAGPTARARGT